MQVECQNANALVAAKLRRFAHAADLSLRELADVLGVEYKTLTNHLGGGPIAKSRGSFYARLERIESLGCGRVAVTLRYVPTRKRWGWKMTALQRRALLVDHVAPVTIVKLARGGGVLVR